MTATGGERGGARVLDVPRHVKIRRARAEPAIVRIDNAISTLTLQLNQIGQNGIAFAIGRIAPVPEPATAALSVLGGMAMLVLRRKQ